VPCLPRYPIFNAIRMFTCSSCTWPLCLAIVADMLKPYMSVVMFESKGKVTVKPQSYNPPWLPPMQIILLMSTLGVVCQKTHLQMPLSRQPHGVQVFRQV
jgi:hypothetical protein